MNFLYGGGVASLALCYVQFLVFVMCSSWLVLCELFGLCYVQFLSLCSVHIVVHILSQVQTDNGSLFKFVSRAQSTIRRQPLLADLAL